MSNASVLEESSGCIIDYHKEGHWIVVPTNIGWKKDGANPMGVGIAKDIVELYPDLAKWYGERCKRYGEETAVTPYKPGSIILFPTKPLDAKNPHASWKSKSDISLVEKSLKQLVACADIMTKCSITYSRIGVPMVGCGAGQLPKKAVLVLLHQYLDNRFLLFV